MAVTLRKSTDAPARPNYNVPVPASQRLPEPLPLPVDYSDGYGHIYAPGE